MKNVLNKIKGGQKADESDKCQVCGKVVNTNEKIAIEQKLYHKTCVQCEVCKKKLAVGDFFVHDGNIFCKQHKQNESSQNGESHYERIPGERSDNAPKVNVDSRAVQELAVMFPNLSNHSIASVLSDCGGNVDRAIDNLLNLAALQVSPQSTSETSPRNQPTYVNTSSQAASTRPKEEPKKTAQNPPVKSNAPKETRSIDDQLLQATKESNVQMVKHFMREIRPFLNRDIKSLLTSCLLLSIERGNTELMTVFIENGADVDAPNAENMTPLMLALMSQQLDCAKALIGKYKADPNKLSGSSPPPFHFAIQSGFTELAKLMMEKGVDINFVDESGKTPLHVAVSSVDYDIASKLLDAHADLAFKDRMGDTPLHQSLRVCKTAKEMMVTCLLLEKARDTRTLDLQNHKTGETALHIAVLRGKALVDLILPFSPNLTIKNAEGKTPYELAVSKNETKSMEMLLKAMQEKGITPWKQSNNPPAPTVAPVKLGSSAKVEVTSDSDEEEGLQSKRKPKGLAASTPIPVSKSPQSTPVKQPEVKKPAENKSVNPTPTSWKPNVDPVGLGSVKISPQDPDFLAVNEFFVHITESLKSNEFEKEFLNIEEKTANANLVGDFSSALQPYNIKKNRYKNILPYEKTRVVLTENENLGSDYISANYVSGEVPGSERSYIATQGPLQHTVNDFWRMIWEHRISQIVMLANEVENGREKVFPYWPEDSEIETEDFKLSKVKSEKLENDSVITRGLSLTNRKTGESRTIKQVHYIGWPDQGLPPSTEGFRKVLDLTELSVPTSEAETKAAPPVLVHCSAGIGRTGVFCAVHAVTAKLRLLLTATTPQLKISLKEVILKMRDERAGMVQTQEQYAFIYMSLLDKLKEVLKVLEYKNEAWFHKTITSEQANRMIEGKPHGTFLFRTSSSPGAIVLTMVNGREITHARIGVTEKGFQIDSENFSNLSELVKSRPQVLIYPIARQK